MISIQHVCLADRGWVQVWFDNGYAGFCLQGWITAPKAGPCPLGTIMWNPSQNDIHDRNGGREWNDFAVVLQLKYCAQWKCFLCWSYCKNMMLLRNKLYRGEWRLDVLPELAGPRWQVSTQKTWSFLCYILTLIWQLDDQLPFVQALTVFCSIHATLDRLHFCGSLILL